MTLTLLGHNAAVYAATFLLERRLSAGGLESAEWAATLLLSPFCFVFAETLPKHLGYLHADAFCRAAAPLARLSGYAFFPFSKLLGLIRWALRRALGRLGAAPLPLRLRDEVLAHLDLGLAEGLWSPTQRRLADRILSAGRRPLRALMRPLRQAATLKRSATCAAALELLRAQGANEALILDNRRAEVLGVVTLQKLLRDNPPPESPALDAAEAPILLDEAAPVPLAGRRLSHSGARLAVVTVQGAAAGIVLENDILHEMVGLDP